MVELQHSKKKLFELSNETKYWFKLLQHFDNKNYFYNGLTLPFIIGSKIYIEPEEKLQSIREIIEDFNSSKFFINVLKCGCIGEYVFRISDSGDENIYRKLETFVITDSSFSNYTNIEEIIEELENEYGNCIKDGKFSKINGFWRSFCLDNDIPKIKEIR
jgi:hypothetical protein